MTENNPLGKCPRCTIGNIIINRTMYGDEYICSNQVCDFKVANYYQFNTSDMKKVLNGTYSTSKMFKTKDGKGYYAFMYLNGDKLQKTNEIGLCPKCKSGMIRELMGKDVESFFACKDITCDLVIPSWHKLNSSDIRRMIAGKDSSIKTYEKKDGTKYKAIKFFDGYEVKMQFVNK